MKPFVDLAMKTAQFRLLLGFAVMLGAITVARSAMYVPAPASATGEKLYVAIEYFDPAAFDRLRYSALTGDEVILSTLKATAATQAQAAGYNGEVAVLDDGAKAPEGAPVLRLTWGIAAGVTVDLLEGGKSTYLGIAGRLPLTAHPDHDSMQRRLDKALMPASHQDEALRVRTEMELFTALQYVVEYRQKSSKT